jgi:hypothetical protein
MSSGNGGFAGDSSMGLIISEQKFTSSDTHSLAANFRETFFPSINDILNSLAAFYSDFFFTFF